MKWLKTYKLFEAWVEQPKFYRFSHVDLLGDESEKDITPSKRTMVGKEQFNDVLVKLGFPDRSLCIHMMDSLAFDPSLKSLYGKNIYQVLIDEDSHIGWSFTKPINDWYYKSGRGRPGQVDKDLQKTDYVNFNPYDSTDEELLSATKILVDTGAIGTGKLKDLMSSKYWGSNPVFVWTTDTVKVSRYQKPVKATTTYKSEPVLRKEDFTELGLSADMIPKFYQSEFGSKIKSMDPNLDFDLRREQAVNFLNSWVKTLKKFETIGYSELTDDIWNDMSDILLELEDEGFSIQKDYSDTKKVANKLCEDVVEITISKPTVGFLPLSTKMFPFSQIEDTVRRLIDYMLSKKWNYSLMFYGDYKYVEFETGGDHELSQGVPHFTKTEAEKMLHKSLMRKILENDCHSFKVVFYYEINRVIQ